MDKSLEIIAEGYTRPAFFNDRIIQEGLRAAGMNERDSRYYINSTCVEITPIAASNVQVATPYINLNKAFEYILNGGKAIYGADCRVKPEIEFNLADLAKIGPASLFAGISTQPAPVPDLQFSSAGAVNRLTWDDSAAGYRLQASDGLDGWINLGSVITGAGNFEDTANDLYRRFYRLFKP